MTVYAKTPASDASAKVAARSADLVNVFEGRMSKPSPAYGIGSAGDLCPGVRTWCVGGAGVLNVVPGV
jgi:hypothetical protein